MNKNITLDKILLIISILILINFAIMGLYFHMSWKDDTVTIILGVSGTITVVRERITTDLVFICAVYPAGTRKNRIRYLIYVINIILIEPDEPRADMFPCAVLLYPRVGLFLDH